MMIWLAYVDTLDTLFDPEIHCVPGNTAFGMTMTYSAGAVVSINVERQQVGWALMHPDAPRCVIVAESITGDPEDAVVIARGRITSIPGDLFQNTQTIEIACAPENIFEVGNGDDVEDGPVMDFARSNLDTRPHVVWSLEDMDRDDPASYLRGRSAVYHIDPATHEVTISDMIQGDRVVNLSRAHFHDDQTRPETEWGEMPVGRARLAIRGAWTQEASDYCDLRPAIVQSSGRGTDVITTLSPDFITDLKGDLPDGMLNMRLGAGWSLADSWVLMSPEFPSRTIFSGRLYDVRYDLMPSGEGLPPYSVTVEHREKITFKEWAFSFRHLWMKYELAQEREEVAHLMLDMPVQSVPITETEADEGEITAIDLTIDPDAEPYEPGEYHAGDRVSLGSRIYECLEDHVSTSLYQLPPGYIPTFQWIRPHPYWKRVPPNSVIPRSAGELFTTDAGREIIAHGMLRLRKRLLERSRALRISLQYRWEDARDVTLRDSVRVEVPWHDGTHRAVVGKVVGIEKHVDGVKGATISITIAVSLGTGTDGAIGERIHPGYGSTDNYMSTIYLQAPSPSEDLMGVGGDTAYLIDPDPVRRPVNIDKLRLSSYACRYCDRVNEAPSQLGKASEYAVFGKDPRWAIQKNPTRLQIEMRDLVMEGVLDRDVYVAGDVLASPRGIDLIQGEEP